VRGIAQGQAFDAVLLDQRQRGADEGRAQVTVMVGAFGFHPEGFGCHPIYFI
jgi:hypothetical protein